MNLRARRLSGFARVGLYVWSLLVPAALTGPISGQQPSLAFSQGTHLFRRILHDLHLTPLQNLDLLTTEPADKLLIVLGETELVETRLRLREFVSRGGAVLVATDRECRNLERPFGVRVS